MLESGTEGQTASAAGEWSLKAVQRLLWQRRWLVVAIAAEVFIITGLVTFLRTPMYDASARILIERSTPKVMESDDVMPMVWNEFEIQRFYQTQYLLLKDPRVLIKALHRKDYPVRERILALLTADSEGEDGGPLPDDGDLARWIKDRLKVEQLEYSSVVKVTFRHSSPELAADVVNAVVHAYQDFFGEEIGLAPRMKALNVVEEGIVEANADLKDIEDKLNRITQVRDTSLSASDSEIGKTRLQRIDATLTEAKSRKATAEARLHAYQQAEPMSLEEVRGNLQILKYHEQMASIQAEIADLEGKVGDGWPHLRELRTALAETRENLTEEARRLYLQALESARAEVDVARQEESRLKSLYEQELRATNQKQYMAGDVETLRRAYEQKKSNLERLLARREEVARSSDLREILERQVAIIGTARPPEGPAVPRVKLNLALGLVFGLFLGVGAAFLAEAMDNKVRGGQQLAELTGLPLLGSIPRLTSPQKPRLAFSRAKQGTTPVIEAEKSHDVEEAFRAMRSALLLSQAERPPGSLMVTSALPGEGKSTIAANFGRTLASFGHKVVMVDADLRHPRLHRVFKADKNQGLTNVLASAMPVEDVVVATCYPNLFLVPGGPCPPDPATLLDRDKLKAIITRLGERFEFVIVDTPPVLVFADSFNIVPAVEGCLFVARSMATQKDAVRQAVAALRKVNTSFVGVVLNGEVAEERSGSYYRYYHYRKGYYRHAMKRHRKEEKRREEAETPSFREPEEGPDSKVVGR